MDKVGGWWRLWILWTALCLIIVGVNVYNDVTFPMQLGPYYIQTWDAEGNHTTLRHVEINGKKNSFPEDATDAQIRTALHMNAGAPLIFLPKMRTVDIPLVGMTEFPPELSAEDIGVKAQQMYREKRKEQTVASMQFMSTLLLLAVGIPLVFGFSARWVWRGFRKT